MGKTLLCLMLTPLCVSTLTGQMLPRSPNVRLQVKASENSAEIVKLNGELEARFVKVGRTKSKDRLTVTVELKNGSSKVAYLALVNIPLATDDVGGSYQISGNPSGVGFCRNWGSPVENCIKQDSGATVPLMGFTRIDPGKTIPISMVMAGNPSSGAVISLSMDFLCRFVADPDADKNQSDIARYRQFELISVGFPGREVGQAN